MVDDREIPTATAPVVDGVAVPLTVRIPAMHGHLEVVVGESCRPSRGGSSASTLAHTFAIDSVHAKVWASVLADQPPGEGRHDPLRQPRDSVHRRIPHGERHGDARRRRGPSRSISRSSTRAASSRIQQAEGYTITTTGSSRGRGSSPRAARATSSYQSTELACRWHRRRGEGPHGSRRDVHAAGHPHVDVERRLQVRRRLVRPQHRGSRA